ncbi:MAG: hypothetical protein RL304_157 [Verrucomicrobiota bacterium]
MRQSRDGSTQLSLLPESPTIDLSANHRVLTERLTALLGARTEVTNTDLIAPEDSGKFRLTVRTA